MKQIYSMLNEVDTNLESYERESLTDLEKLKMMRSIKGIKGKKKSYKGITSVACAAIVIVAMGSVAFDGEAHAAAKSIAWQIGNFLGIESNLQDYTTVLNTSIEDKGYTITLNEVILDANELVVSTTIKSDKIIPEFGIVATGTVYVNGKMISFGGGGGSKNIDDYTEESVMKYELEGVDSNAELDIDIIFEQMGHSEEAVNGNWRFHFVADGTALAVATKHILLDESFTLPNDAVVSLTEYTSNDLGTKIYFDISAESAMACAEYDMILKGEDDRGNSVEFSLSMVRGIEGYGKFERDRSADGINQDAERITLIPYAVAFPEASGRLSNDFVPVGESFVIEI